MTGSRWTEAEQALAKLVEKVAKYDNDGVDIYFLNNKRTGNGLNVSTQVRCFFGSVTPDGMTPIGARLEQIAGKYVRETIPIYIEHPDDLNEYVKPVVYVVITDGCPTDDPGTVIEGIAKRLDQNNFPVSQVGIQFVQIGNDLSATRFLKKLDDELSPMKGIRDIVDTTPYKGVLNDEMLIKVMLGGINKRVDRDGGKAMMF
ncbi:hypothetical protein BDQ17DRAFT_1391354 [Cyathus striatus]|nr:hypothetical protein BDQ17DRAFT_1391354 [Cyathus striatus]